MTSFMLWQNLNVLFFQCALTAQMSRKLKSSEPDAVHVAHISKELETLNIKQFICSENAGVLKKNATSEMTSSHCAS